MNLKSFQERIERVGTNLDPDEDWMPVLFLEKDNDMAMVGLLMMEDEQQKDMCAFVMEQLVRTTNPDSACFLSTAWMSRMREDNTYKNDEEIKEAYRTGEILPPSKDPNRKEIVIAVCIGVKGENDGEAMMMGEIERSPDGPPRIKEWTIHDDEWGMSGRFADAIKKGFASVDSSGDLSRLSKMKGLIDETRNNSHQD